MIDHLFPYYERELRYVNLLAQEFARRHPGAAARLGLEVTGSSDPYVQRLLETFALLAGRTHAKIEDEYPELTDGLLHFLYPHFLAPIPSMAMLQLEPDPDRVQAAQGFTVAAGSMVGAATEPVPCKFRTTYPVTLWPIRVNRASFRVPPFPAGLQPPPGTVAALRLELQSVGEMTFSQLKIESLRFFLSGDPLMVPDLHEMLLNNALQILLVPHGASGKGVVALSPDNWLHAVGFERDEGMLPYQDNARMGYRLLTEFFAFPAKFQFVELRRRHGSMEAPLWSHFAANHFGHQCEIIVFCGKTNKTLEQGVDSSTFRMGCTPVVNLFEKSAESIPMVPRLAEYPIVADRTTPQAAEIYSVSKVTTTDAAENRVTHYPEFYALEHSQGTRGNRIFWYTTRRRSLAENDQGTDVYLSFVNLHFESRWPAAEVVNVECLCTNRDLPLAIGASSKPVAWELELPAPVNRITCLRTPTPSLRPAARNGGACELISHLSPSTLSLQGGGPGRTALRDILRLYDFSDPAAGQKHLKEQAMQIVESVLDVRYRRVLGRVPSDPRRGLCRGVEVTLDLDPTRFPQRGPFLFAMVFERFLGLYATTNSFTELILKTSQGLVKKWPARTGEIPLI
jgi:type VI secretion system protein ImpG